MMLKREHKQPNRFFTGVQRLVHARHAPLLERRDLDDAARRDRAAAVRRHGADRRRPVARHAGLAGARRGPGLLHRRGDPARRRALQRTDKVVNEVVDILTLEPGQPGRGRVHRLRLPRRRLPQQRGDDLRHAEAVGRAQREHAAAGRRVLHEDRPHQGGPGARLRAAGDLRPRHGRRLRALHPEPRRGRAGGDAAGAAGAARPPELGPDARRRADAVARQRAAALRRRRPREGEGARRADRATCSRRCRPRSAATTSTTSTSTAAPGRC